MIVFPFDGRSLDQFTEVAVVNHASLSMVMDDIPVERYLQQTVRLVVGDLHRLCLFHSVNRLIQLSRMTRITVHQLSILFLFITPA
jgi:hypothetical protein